MMLNLHLNVLIRQQLNAPVLPLCEAADCGIINYQVDYPLASIVASYTWSHYMCLANS